MKKTLLVSLLALCTTPALAGELEDRTAAARGIVKEFAGSLQGELKAALDAGGPTNAIQVCSDKAPEIAAGLSKKHGGRVARTSLKLRNPSNAPDAWETKVLNDFEARKAKGEDPGQIETAEIITNKQGKREFRYMKAIAIAPNQPCLKCHGDAIEAPVSSKLNELYKQDKATGYKVGDLRGAFTISQPM
jgi:hypothetical protein